MATDPVCGMFVEEGDVALRLVRDNRTYFFCSSACLRTFAAPEEERHRIRTRLLLAWPLAIAVAGLTYGVGGREAAVASALLAAVVQFYSGGPFYRGAFDALRTRTGNMDLLIAVGTSAAFFYSVAVLLIPTRLPPSVYFDASSLIVTIILTGNYLELVTRSKAGSALLRLGELLPTEVRIVRGATESSIPVGEASVGDLLRITPGSRLAVDGIVRQGRTFVDDSILTGEPLPLEKKPGDRVLAGSMNLDGLLLIEATGTGGDTFIAHVGALLSDAEMARVPLRSTADRIASIFVPVVLGLAVVASVVWGVVGGAPFTVALLIFVTVSITACPCAFGLATPAAILVGTGRAAAQGILFRGGDAIERAATVDVVLTDKTGTLTAVTPEVSSIKALPPFSEVELLATAAGLESSVPHPLARAVRVAAETRGVVPRTFDEVTVQPGRGVGGRSGQETIEIVRGDRGVPEGGLTGEFGRWVQAVEGRGETWSTVLAGGRPAGGLAFRAPPVSGAREAVDRLRRDGLEVVMVTGDQETTAREVARAVGIDIVHAGVTPAGKVELIRSYRASGRHVGFVGDGVNDAAALAEADAGLAIGSGTDVAREAGQILLVRNDFRSVPEALALARRIVRRVRGNLFWAVGYNAVLLPIAMGLLVPFLGFGVYGLLPVAGAVAMGLSSTTVVLNSLTLRWGSSRPSRSVSQVARPATSA